MRNPRLIAIFAIFVHFLNENLPVSHKEKSLTPTDAHGRVRNRTEPWARLRAQKAQLCAGSELPLAAGRPPRKATVAQLKAREDCYSRVFTETAVKVDGGLQQVSSARVGCHAQQRLCCHRQKREPK